VAQARKGAFGLKVVPPSQAKRGDLVLFDWQDGGDATDHIGRLVRPVSGNTVTTVDGNAGNPQEFVIVRERESRLVRAFVRDS
jgi:hypothetical protein